MNHKNSKQTAINDETQSEGSFAAPSPGDAPPPSSPPSTAAAAGTPPPGKPNPFDPARLRVATDYVSALNLVKVATACPARKPNDQQFVRANPDPNRRITMNAIHVKDDRDGIYVVAPEIVPEIPELVVPTQFVESITRQGAPFLWFVKMASKTGKTGLWVHSSLAAIKEAERAWVKVQWNGSSYDVLVAPGISEIPVWPTMPFEKVLELAFRNFFVDSLDHPVIKALRGEE